MVYKLSCLQAAHRADRVDDQHYRVRVAAARGGGAGGECGEWRERGGGAGQAGPQGGADRPARIPAEPHQ